MNKWWKENMSVIWSLHGVVMRIWVCFKCCAMFDFVYIFFSVIIYTPIVLDDSIKKLIEQKLDVFSASCITGNFSLFIDCGGFWNRSTVFYALNFSLESMNEEQIKENRSFVSKLLMYILDTWRKINASPVEKSKYCYRSSRHRLPMTYIHRTREWVKEKPDKNPVNR